MKKFRFARRTLGIAVVVLAAMLILSPATTFAARPTANTTFTGTAKHNGHTAAAVTAIVKSSRSKMTSISFTNLKICATSSIAFTNVTVHSNGHFATDFNGVFLNGKFTTKHHATGTLKWAYGCQVTLTFALNPQGS